MAVSYAYFLLLRDCALRDARIGLAQTFPLHITVRGRFRPRETFSLADLIEVGRQALHELQPFSCELSGPVRVGEDLLWYEIEPGANGFDNVMRAHIRIEQAVRLADIVEFDHVMNSHRLEHFRPHVTVAFESISQDFTKSWPTRLTAHVDGWALYQYDGDAVDSSARVVHVNSFRSDDL